MLVRNVLGYIKRKLKKTYDLRDSSNCYELLIFKSINKLIWLYPVQWLSHEFLIKFWMEEPDNNVFLCLLTFLHICMFTCGLSHEKFKHRTSELIGETNILWLDVSAQWQRDRLIFRIL
jgi:hypothetical protein